MFNVVEFEESGGVAVVRSSWLTPRKKEVFWPPHKQTYQFNKVLKQDEPINTETWTLHKIKRCFYETDDYDVARIKLKKAEDTSDLLSEAEDSDRKRKIRKPRRLSYSSSCDENTSENTNSIKRPPAVQRINLVDSSQHNRSPKITNSKDGPKADTPTTSMSSTKSDTSTYSSEEFQRKLLTILCTIKEQNSQILNQLLTNKNGTLIGMSAILPEDFPKLPLNSQGDLDALETCLENKENQNLLMSYLARIGGKDASTKTNRILKILISDELASRYNFYGKRDKIPFSNLRIKTADVDAVKLQSTTTEKEVEDSIKVWLKHAPQRLNRSRPKN